MTCGEIVREYFPNITDECAEFILWGHTGFPGFWNIPEDGLTVEECLRTQLKAFKEEINVHNHKD